MTDDDDDCMYGSNCQQWRLEEQLGAQREEMGKLRARIKELEGERDAAKNAALVAMKNLVPPPARTAEEERADVVAWLRMGPSHSPLICADRAERGEHVGFIARRSASCSGNPPESLPRGSSSALKELLPSETKIRGLLLKIREEALALSDQIERNTRGHKIDGLASDWRRKLERIAGLTRDTGGGRDG